MEVGQYSGGAYNMYQRLDYFNWTCEQAARVVELLEGMQLLEDYESITEIDGSTNGFFEFTKIDSSEVEYMGDHWMQILNVQYMSETYSLLYDELQYIPDSPGLPPFLQP